MKRADLAVLGAAVAAGLAKGRQRAIAKARQAGSYSVSLVAEFSAMEDLAGRPTRGRAGRIARRLHGRLSERQVRRILDTLSSVSESEEQDAENNVGERHGAAQP